MTGVQTCALPICFPVTIGVVQGEKQEPDIEPGRVVDVGAGDPGAKAGFEKRGHSTDPGQAEEKEDRQIERSQGVDGAPDH